MMVRKLLSGSLRKIEWRSLAKIAGSAFLLFLAWRMDASWGMGIVVFGYLWFVFVSEFHDRKALAALYWVSGVASYLGVVRFAGPEGSGWGAFAVVLAHSAALATMLGVSRFVFRERERFYHVLHSAVIASVFLLFFSGPLSWHAVALLGIALTLLMREFFAFTGIPWRGRALLAAVALAFLGFEIALISRALPLGFVNAAVFASVFLVLTRDVVRAHFGGMFRLPLILRDVAIFLFVSSVIFSLAPWTI